MNYKDTTVIIPVKNEPAVASVINDVIKSLPGCSVIVIYKGNINKLPRRRNLITIRQNGVGKGNACVQAAEHADGKILCLIDGDSTYSASDLKPLIQEVRKGAMLAIGNRFAHMEKNAMPPYVRFGNKLLTFTLNLLYGTRIYDSQSGIRAILKSAFNEAGITEQGFGIEEEMLIKVKRMGGKISEVPATYRKRVGESKQLKPLDGLKLELILFKLLFR